MSTDKIIDSLTHTLWDTDDKWFCSELIAHSTGRFFDVGRVTPQMLYLISRPV